MTNHEFAEYVLKQVDPAGSSSAAATYDPDGDCIEFIAAPDSFYAERIDTLLTVYRSQQTDEVVGSLIKGVSRFLREVVQRAPGFRIEVRDGRIKLVHIFTAKMWSEQIDPKAIPSITYQKLREVAEQTGTEVEVGTLLLA